MAKVKKSYNFASILSLVKIISFCLLQENNDGEDSQESINHENEEEPINDDPRLLRDQLADWFINEGEVPFQYAYALRTTRNMQ